MSHWTKFIFVFGSCVSTLVAAEDTINSSKFNWGGFVTQGWAISDENNFFGSSSEGSGSLEYRELGLNGSYIINPEFRLSGQLLSRVSGEVDDGSPSVDYLLLDWSFNQSMDQQSGLRIGRIKNPIGFFNDTRDVAFTRPSIILPQSIYLDRAREVALSADGVSFYSRTTMPDGYLNFDVTLGYPRGGGNTEVAFLTRDWAGGFDDPQMVLARLLYEDATNRYRLGLSYASADLPYTAGATDPFSDGEVKFSLIGISAQLNWEYWSLTTEIVNEVTERQGFGGFFSASSKNDIQAYYIQLDRRFSPEFSGFVRYDEVLVDKYDPDGSVYAGITGRPAFERFAKDWTFGVAYQPDARWLFRAEWHRIEGTAWLSGLDNPDPADTREDWNLAILQASYRF